MDTTDLLIIAMAAGPIAASLLAPGFTGALLALARARAQRVRHVPASGADLYRCGVPLDEGQFRDAFNALQAELEELGPQADRNEWQLKQGFAANIRFSLLTGAYPGSFPIRSTADNAWQWYSENNPYATPSSRSGMDGACCRRAPSRPDQVSGQPGAGRPLRRMRHSRYVGNSA